MASSYKLFVMGNPLLDIQVTNGESLLEKYKLNANDAILAGETHAPIYEEVVSKHQVTYVAGGAAQNTARGAAYVLPPNSVVYAGCVGDDDFAEQLKAANKREGLDQLYQVKKGEKTGACAVVITGHHRSLVTDLRAAEKFDQSHLSTPEVAAAIDAAEYYYVEGYFLTHGTPIVQELSKKSSEASKVFTLNLSAPFVAQFFNSQVQSVLPYCDIVIGNEAEAEAYAAAVGLPDPKDIPAVARAIASFNKTNPARPRTVIITQGKDSTIVVQSDNDKHLEFPVHALTDNQIIDTNGAGDAFCGGYLGALIAGKSLEEAIEAGHALARQVIQLVGPQYQWPKVKIF